jgi:uncharacterized membrane protein YhfC
MLAFAGAISIFIIIILPLTLAIYLSVKHRGQLRHILLGAGTFFISQVLIRIPIIQYVLPRTTWYNLLPVTSPIAYIIFLSFTAGLFEEAARYVAMGIFMKRQGDLIDGISFGIGHGGIEAILMVGVNLAVALLNSVLQDPYEILLAGFERLSAMAFHVGASVLIFYGLKQRKPVFLPLCIAVHTIFNTIPMLMLQNGISIIYVELVIFLAGASTLFFAIRLFSLKKAANNQQKEEVI